MQAGNSGELAINASASSGMKFLRHVSLPSVPSSPWLSRPSMWGNLGQKPFAPMFDGMKAAAGVALMSKGAHGSTRAIVG